MRRSTPFGGADGEGRARAFEVYGYAFMTRRPPEAGPAPTGSELTVPSSPGQVIPGISDEYVTDRKQRGPKSSIALYPA